MLKGKQGNPLLFQWFQWLAMPSGSVWAAEALPSRDQQEDDQQALPLLPPAL